MSDKKKIIIIGPAFPYRGGNSLFVSHVYDMLKNDFDVEVLNYKLLYPSLLFPGTTQYDKSGVNIKKVPNTRVVNSINPLSWIKTAGIIKEKNPDLVVFDWWHPFFGFCHYGISSFIKSKFKGKILFITENVVSHEGNFVDKFLTRIGLRNADKFLVLSNKVENELRSLGYKNKVYKSELPIYDCYDVNASSPSSKEEFGFSTENKILLFQGYIRKYKGLDLLIEAMPELIKIDPQIRLLAAGEFYDDPSFYTKKIGELNLTGHVKIVNEFIANEDLKKYYDVSDLVVLPYRSATQSGILNVAYGFGKPVLVTNVGGLAEFVDHEKTGIVIDSADTGKIVTGVKHFYDLKNDVDFAQNIRARVGNNLFNQLPQLFESIINDT